MRSKVILLCSFLCLHFCRSLSVSTKCPQPFEGFGVYLGQAKSFNATSPEIRRSVLDTVYYDLKLRFLRTEYPHQFSTVEDEYKITCNDISTCTWITMHSLLSNYSGLELFVSVWSPPLYMVTSASTLKPDYETKYRDYLTEITRQAEHDYNLTIARVSFANEPEYFAAPWTHCFMLPDQVCRLANNFDEKMRVCPETAYFWMAKSYLVEGGCNGSCSIVAAHGYKPIVRTGSSNGLQLRVHYDTGVNENDLDQPVWITELSSTLTDTELPNEMDFAFDLATSIINFVGSTCAQRVYHWLAYTTFPSGESLLYSNSSDLIKPKKYYAYRHFTRASWPGNRTISRCSTKSYSCLAFDDRLVYVNRRKRNVAFDRKSPSPSKICCTELTADENCYDSPTELPSKSICSTVSD